MANIFRIDRTNNKIEVGTTETTINIGSHSASSLLALDASKNLTTKVIGTDVQAHGDVLDDLNGLGANSADGEFLVGTGAGVLDWESGATARTSIGLGTDDSPIFAGLTLVNAITEFSTDGTLGDDSDSAVPTEKAVKTYADSLGYVDRGDVSVSDFDEGDSPTEGAWTDLDLGPNGLNIVPAGTKAICLFLRIKDDSVSEFLQVRCNGYSAINPGNILLAKTRIANVTNYESGVIGCDSNGVIEYYIDTGVSEFDLTVTGWFI